MKRGFLTVGLLCLAASKALAVPVSDVVARNQKLPRPQFPVVEAGRFKALHEAATGGNTSSSDELYSLISKHIQAVYSPLEKHGGLLFSFRRPDKEFDDPDNNYAVNLESFFKETTDDVRIRKRDFKVHTLDGSEYTVFFPEYKPVSAAVKVQDGEEFRLLPLSELTEKDRLFVESALVDELFDSRSFKISIDDKRLRGEDVETSHYKVVFTDGTRKDSSDFEKTELKAVSRTIVLENEGRFPLKNLIVEYQVFIEQTVMGLPDDFPEDYRYVGFFEVPSLAPDEVKRLPLALPEVVNKQLEDNVDGDRRYSVFYPAGINDYSEGRINGIKVKVHRITPYGERLTVEHQSPGTPSAKWTAVAAVGAGIR